MKEKIINVLGIRRKMILCRIKGVKDKCFNVYVEKITKEQEDNIDKAVNKYGEIKYKINDKILIGAKDIYLYGEININDNNDLNQIKKCNLIDDNGGTIYSNFDYEKGKVTVYDNIIRYYNTWNTINWFKFCYCLIGKPERIIIYRMPVNIK